MGHDHTSHARERPHRRQNRSGSSRLGSSHIVLTWFKGTRKILNPNSYNDLLNQRCFSGSKGKHLLPISTINWGTASPQAASHYRYPAQSHRYPHRPCPSPCTQNPLARSVVNPAGVDRIGLSSFSLSLSRALPTADTLLPLPALPSDPVPVAPTCAYQCRKQLEWHFCMSTAVPIPTSLSRH